MLANDLLKYRDKIIDAFKDDTFLSEHLKKQMMVHIIMCCKM